MRFSGDANGVAHCQRGVRVRRIALLCALALSGCSAPVPPLFESPEHKFRVRFGSPPAVHDKADGPYASQLFTVTSASGAYTVRAYKLSITVERATGASAQILDDAKNDLVKSVGGTPTESASVALAGKYPGRAFTATATEPKPGVLRGRVYLAGTRLYKVSVFGTPDFANAPDATAFLESFSVFE